MAWTVLHHPTFDVEFEALSHGVRLEILAMTGLLERLGPMLGRPHADTLSGSRFANMKELRFTADHGVWRVAFAFDLQRQAIVLVAGDKAGVNQTRFYRTLIAKADARFADHLEQGKG
jgi:hypothetical protein